MKGEHCATVRVVGFARLRRHIWAAGFEDGSRCVRASGDGVAPFLSSPRARPGQRFGVERRLADSGRRVDGPGPFSRSGDRRHGLCLQLLEMAACVSAAFSASGNRRACEAFADFLRALLRRAGTPDERARFSSRYSNPVGVWWRGRHRRSLCAAPARRRGVSRHPRCDPTGLFVSSPWVVGRRAHPSWSGGG